MPSRRRFNLLLAGTSHAVARGCRAKVSWQAPHRAAVKPNFGRTLNLANALN